MLYSIVIPVYNSGTSLIELNQRLINVMSAYISSGIEIIYVNDSPADSPTKSILNDICSENNIIKVLNNQTNIGQHSSIYKGIEFSQGDYIIVMDDDFQHLPEEISKLIANNSHDVVMGKFDIKHHSLKQRAGSMLKRWLEIGLFGRPRDLYISTFVLMKRPIAQTILEFGDIKPIIGCYLYHATKDIINVEVMHGKRRHGESGYTIKKQIALMRNLFHHEMRFRKMQNLTRVNLEK
jgi:glycosyltransferase involved in cell wall biosynthesis